LPRESEQRPEPEREKTPTITHEMIERRAFELWLVRGGSPDDNWLDAERELREEYGIRDGGN
jgi:hypothetical protein